tara:strand:+ start:23256 stop:23714 length:459 start_codon:yes stop_codon:yes gene_type:complete
MERVYDFNPREDYLKYWRVLRYFVKAKYKITNTDLDMILFLYSEKYFNKTKFNEFDKILTWNPKRFSFLVKEGWVEVFRKRKGKEVALYQLSYKGKRMVGMIYKKLNGEEFPEAKSVNPLFLANGSYTDKLYRDMIKEMNAFIRQQRRLSRQ